MKCAASPPGISPLMYSALMAHLSRLFLWLILLGMGACAGAQSNEIYLSPATNQSKPMTVNDVIKLSKAGLGDDLIIEQIKKKGQRFDLSTDQLIQLKAASVSERVIAVMINPNGGSPLIAEQKPDSTAPSASAVPSAQLALQANRQAYPPNAVLPTDIGVYAKQQGKWIEVLPEVVNWKTGGVVKSVATVGVVKGDVNGHVNGSSSRNRLTAPIDFLIVAPEGDAITEYQLLHLHAHGDSREFRAVTGGVFHVSGGAARDLVQFESTKTASRTYIVNISLGSGEYGFLPPGAFTSTNAASSGKIYSFRVIE
jgi:hypothetical protein